jgi:DNA-binding GntR family transcriptional regulator
MRTADSVTWTRGPARRRRERGAGGGNEERSAPRTARNYVSKSDMVTDALRELITGGQISPGTPLRQRQLAKQFDVSYAPMREALCRLESEGLT